MIESWPAKGISPYPHKFSVDLRIPEYVAKYESAMGVAEAIEGEIVSIAGRVMSTRAASSKLQFYDLAGEGSKVQVMLNLAAYSDAAGYEFVRDNVRRGDIIGKLTWVWFGLVLTVSPPRLQRWVGLVYSSCLV